MDILLSQAGDSYLSLYLFIGPKAAVPKATKHIFIITDPWNKEEQFKCDTRSSIQYDSLFFASQKIEIKDGYSVSLPMRYTSSKALNDSLKTALK